jgi:hypothetical protein
MTMTMIATLGQIVRRLHREQEGNTVVPHFLVGAASLAALFCTLPSMQDSARIAASCFARQVSVLERGAGGAGALGFSVGLGAGSGGWTFNVSAGSGGFSFGGGAGGGGVSGAVSLGSPGGGGGSGGGGGGSPPLAAPPRPVAGRGGLVAPIIDAF